MLKIASAFQTPWEFLVIVLPCGKVLLRVMCLGKPLIADLGRLWGEEEVR